MCIYIYICVCVCVCVYACAQLFLRFSFSPLAGRLVGRSVGLVGWLVSCSKNRSDDDDSEDDSDFASLSHSELLETHMHRDRCCHSVAATSFFCGWVDEWVRGRWRQSFSVYSWVCSLVCNSSSRRGIIVNEALCLLCFVCLCMYIWNRTLALLGVCDWVGEKSPSWRLSWSRQQGGRGELWQGKNSLSYFLKKKKALLVVSWCLESMQVTPERVLYVLLAIIFQERRDNDNAAPLPHHV